MAHETRAGIPGRKPTLSPPIDTTERGVTVMVDEHSDSQHSAEQGHTHGGTDAPECSTCRPARNTEFERRLAEVLYAATTGATRPDVPWSSAHQGMWLADAAEILAAYQAQYAEIIRDAFPPASGGERP